MSGVWKQGDPDTCIFSWFVIACLNVPSFPWEQFSGFGMVRYTKSIKICFF